MMPVATSAMPTGVTEKSPQVVHLLCRGQGFVGGEDQVIEQDQRAGTDHGDGAAEDGGEAHRHQQTRHRQAGAGRDTGDYRQEQRRSPDVLHEMMR